MFLVIFASLDKGQHISTPGRHPYDDFFVPGILAYGVIATTFVNMAISTAILRDEGILEADAGHAAAALGIRHGPDRLHGRDHGGHDGDRPRARVRRYGTWTSARPTLPGLVVTLLLGTAAFTTLGIGVTRFVPNSEAAPVVVNLIVLPLTFISSIWFPSDSLPTG